MKSMDPFRESRIASSLNRKGEEKLTEFEKDKRWIIREQPWGSGSLILDDTSQEIKGEEDVPKMKELFLELEQI